MQNEVIKEKAAEMGVKVEDKQLDEHMKEIVKQVGGQKKPDKLLKEQAVTQAQLEVQLRAQMLQDAVQQKVEADSDVAPEKQATAWEDWLKAAMEDAGILYAAGFDPDKLVGSPSPMASSLPGGG